MVVNMLRAKEPQSRFDLAVKKLAAPLDELGMWLARGQHEVFTVRATLTPDMARRILDLNPENRKVSAKGTSSLRNVEGYAEAIKRGEWMLNGSAIVLSRCGRLNDGQHRCHAVIVADKPIDTLIVFGVDRESRMTVDLGRARSPGDFLKMRGEANVNQLAHAINFVWAYDSHRTFSYSASPQQREATLAEHPGIRDAVRAVSTLCSAYKLSVGAIAGAYYVCARVNPGVAAHFLRTVTTGLEITDDRAPAYRLRKRYQDHISTKSKVSSVEQAALFVKAFNAYGRRGIGALTWRRRGEASEGFPSAGE